MGDYEYSSKINELLSIKERKKLLREIQQSKKKLLYGNPQAIAPFIRERLSDRRYSPIAQSVISTPKKGRSDEQYLTLMREHRALIERELQALRLTEELGRKDLERRLELLVTSNGTKNDETLKNNNAEIRSMLKSFHEAQEDIRGDWSSRDPIIRDLKILKTNYLLDGGHDPHILGEIDVVMKEAQRNKRIKTNDNSDWIRRRKELAVADEKSHELRELERQNLDLERQLDITRVRNDVYSERKVKTNEMKAYSDKIDILQKQIEGLQSQIADLCHPQHSEQSFNQSESIPISNVNSKAISGDMETRNVVLLIDFITGIPQFVQSISIMLSLYHGFEKIGNSMSMDSIVVRPRDKTDMDSSTVINIRHPMISCPASVDVFVLLELRVSSELEGEQRVEGWTKLSIFNDQCELKVGKWKESIFRGPAQIATSSDELYRMQQYNRCVLHYRLAFYSSDEAHRSGATSRNYELPLGGYQKTNPFMINNEVRHIDANSDDEKSDVTIDLDERPDLGFQMIRVKNMTIGDGLELAKVRITVYHTTGPKKGQIVMSSEGPVTCSTNAVRAEFKISCYNLGRQLAKFTNADLSAECLVYARFYLEGENGIRENGNVMEREEVLVAWTATHVVKRRRVARTNPSYYTDSLRLLKINRGIHDLPLYEPPALPPPLVFFDSSGFIVGQKIIGRSKLKFRLFHTTVVYDSSTSSDNTSMDEDEDTVHRSLKTWIPIDRTEPPLLPYHHDDGFDLYIDSGRLLPESVTLTKIEGSIVDRFLNSQGPQFSAVTSPFSDIYNPIFKERIEVREPHLTPSSTLLLKILTFDREDRNLVVLGYVALKLFVETGSGRQPHFDNLGVLVSLNVGGHQLRIYKTEPSLSKVPFTESWFERNRIRPIPGASLLVRLYKPQKTADGRSINMDEVPKNYQERLGVNVVAPQYEEGYYYSMNCKPTEGENKIMARHLVRPKVMLQDLMKSKWSERLMEGVSLGQLPESSHIYKFFDMFTKGVFNFNHIAHYVPTNGFKISIDGALNLPWSGYPMGHICLYPPGAMYMKKPLMAYDRPFFLTNLDLMSTHASPIWTDGWKSYRRRKYSRNLVAVLHLHEMKISMVKNDFVFTLENQAWTPICIFDGPYCITKSTQMPLLTGSPTLLHLQELANKTVQQFLTDNIQSKKIVPLQFSSAIIRQCDSRRQCEIQVTAEDELLILDQSFLPQANISAYRSIYESNKDVPFSTTIPVGFNGDTFPEFLRVKFKSLIYKLYEQDGFYLT